MVLVQCRLQRKRLATLPYQLYPQPPINNNISSPKTKSSTKICGEINHLCGPPPKKKLTDNKQTKKQTNQPTNKQTNKQTNKGAGRKLRFFLGTSRYSPLVQSKPWEIKVQSLLLHMVEAHQDAMVEARAPANPPLDGNGT